MLGKVFKYDMKGMAKRLLPLYGLLIIIACLTRGMTALASKFTIFSTISGILLFITILGMIGAFFYTFFTAVMRFYKSVMKEEGYLIHTLPIKKSTFVFSKTAVATLFMFFTIIVVLLAILILVKDYHVFSIMYTTIVEQFTKVGISVPGFLTYMIFMMIIGFISSILFFYCSLCLGQTRSDKKLTYSIVYGLIVYMASQAFSSVILFGYMLINPSFASTTNATITPPEFYTVLGISAVLSIIYVVSYFIISTQTLENKLNME